METLKQQHGHKNEVNYWKLATKLRQLDSSYRLEKYRLFGRSVSVSISSSNWNYNVETWCLLAGSKYHKVASINMSCLESSSIFYTSSWAIQY